MKKSITKGFIGSLIDDALIGPTSPGTLVHLIEQHGFAEDSERLKTALERVRSAETALREAQREAIRETRLLLEGPIRRVAEEATVREILRALDKVLKLVYPHGLPMQPDANGWYRIQVNYTDQWNVQVP